MSGMNLDEFLGHNSRASGNYGKVVRWRKRDVPQIDTLLHTRSSIVALWRHPWQRIAEVDREGEKSREVWIDSFNCWEPEEILKAQYQRDDQGRRRKPPTVCPMCLMIEWLREQVRAEKLSWLDKVFEFKGDDDAPVVYTAGGIINAFSGELSRQEIAELRKAGIRRDEAWTQNVAAKCNYVFSIVDVDDVAKGVQVAIEATALGDAVKRVIRDQIDSLGAADGHPFRNPYVIRWVYRPKEPEFSKKYHALPMPRIAITPEARALILDADPPDISGTIARGNIASLRSVMETVAKIDMPFDSFFAAAEKQEGAPAKQASRPAAATSPSTPKAAPTPAIAPSAPVARRAAAVAPPKKQPPQYPSGTRILPCDACKADMAETDAVCWSCGARYEIDEAPAPAASAAPAAPAAPVADDAEAWPGEDDGVGF